MKNFTKNSRAVAVNVFTSTVILLCSFVYANAQSIFTNPITGTNPGQTSPYTTGQTVNANITVSGISRGAGVNGNNASNRYNTNNWNQTSLANAITANDYLEWTLTPNTGYEIDFVSFVYTGQRSGTGPNNFAFRSSVDGFANDIGAPTATGVTIDLSGAAYQNITSAITFRLYGWGASGAGGTFSVNDFTFNGTVSLVPTCNDGIQNGDETGVDCGGPDCPACPRPVEPVLECVKLNNDGSYTAVFGYLNENAGNVEIPVGVNNELSPGTQNGLLPTTFLPGRQVAAFEIPFDGNDLEWTLEGPDGSSRTVTASANSSACPPDFDCPSLMADIGDPCDDLDPDTENDMVNSDCECEGTPVVASEIELTLDADNTTVACGETVTVEVDISDYTDMASLSFSINFDPSELEYVSYEEITLDGETPIVGEPGVGSVPSDALTYTWLSGGFSGSTGSAQTILRIEFVMLLDVGTTTVTISDNPTTIEAADGNTFDPITVNVGPDLTLTGDQPAPPTCPNDLKVCVSDAAIDLTMLTPGANPAGGTFSGDGVTNNSFDPATAGTGAHTIMYEYTNDQGCTSSCEFEIMVISCQPEISVTDPCSCKNNATTLDNGQFDEFVSVIAPSGQTWTVTAVSGLFSAASSAPPAAPVDNLLGATLTETDNGDGTSTYRIDGIHVDGAGFEITVSNGSASGSVGNTCYYPNPQITGLDDAYCEDDDRQIALAGTIDRGDGMTAATPDAETFAIFDGINPVLDPATALQPSDLGVGLYTVRYTVDAADEGSSEVSPNRFVGFPGCVQSVTQTVEVTPQVAINPLQAQTICSAKRLALADVFDGIDYAGDVSELVYTWSLLEGDADGTLSDTDPADPTAGIYTPGTNDANRGSVTLLLTVDNPDDACEAVQAQVSITIEKVGCGGFPWSGEKRNN